MVTLKTSEEWQRQTSLLLQARPTTTRITTKYNVPNLDSPRYQRPTKRKRDADAEDKDGAGPKAPRAFLTLKTYCPESGVVLKFKTDRAADVGRLVSGLGRAGRLMAALPDKEEAPEAVMEDVPAAPNGEVKKEGNDTKSQGAGGGGGGKKKKKGKK